MSFISRGRIIHHTGTVPLCSTSGSTSAIERTSMVRSDRLGGHALCAHDLAELVDGARDRVDLVLERREPLGRRARRRAGLVLELRLASQDEPQRVALLGDVATDQLTGLDVDRVVAEEAV